jgi:hypothetical protein
MGFEIPFSWIFRGVAPEPTGFERSNGANAEIKRNPETEIQFPAFSFFGAPKV